MEKKKRISIPVVLFAVAVAVVGFLLAMGNYLVAIGITAVVLLVVLYWQWPNILSLRGQTEYAKGNNTKAVSYTHLDVYKRQHIGNYAAQLDTIGYAYCAFDHLCQRKRTKTAFFNHSDTIAPHKFIETAI